MDIQTVVMLLVGVAAIALAVVGIIFVRKEPVSVAGVLTSTVEAVTDIEKAAGAAKEYVLAAEQLWQTGRLDKESRLYFVVTRLKKLFPDIPESTLEDSVEAAVAWIKMTEGRLTSGGAETPTGA